MSVRNFWALNRDGNWWELQLGRICISWGWHYRFFTGFWEFEPRSAPAYRGFRFGKLWVDIYRCVVVWGRNHPRWRE